MGREKSEIEWTADMSDGDSNDEVIVAVVALIVSVVALSATFMQVLQQYYASAAGYSQCNTKVMGDWAKSKTRRFSWEELRFEVQFDAPVIFVSPPDNKRGPIPDAPIYFLDGTQKSLDDTWTTSDMDLRKEYMMLSTKERIHTADNERASWFVLLYAVQRMEAKSNEWQQKQYGPPGELTEKYGLPGTPPSLRDHHTLTVAVQRKRKSWDTMPSSIVKPYATTTMCHLIEMLAALGVYWKEFDRKRDRYWAEGNGFLVLGERLSDLGLMFSVQVYGQCIFESNRVVPVDYVKELCFGYVPTIYRDTIDQSRLRVPSDMPENLGSLQMASIREIGETLTLIGCNNTTVNYFLDDGKRTSHIFPISFEILGMLAQNFHINNSSFTYIPNPTPDRWDKRSLSLEKLLEAFKEHFEQDTGTNRNPAVAAVVQRHTDEILRHYSEKDGAERLLCLRVLHMALEDMDEILTGKPKEPVPQAPATPVVQESAVQVVVCGDGQEENIIHNMRRRMVQDVLRSHIQEVLRLLNDRDERSADAQSLYVPDRIPGSPPLSRYHDRSRHTMPRFDDMDDAGPDERQHRFMDVYFDVVRPRVVPRAAHSTSRRASVVVAGRPQSLPNLRGERLSIFADAAASISRPASSNGSAFDLTKDDATTGVDGSDGGDEDITSQNGDDTANDDGESHVKPEGRPAVVIPLAMQAVSHDDVWCVLVFRMICWLMMHDFHRLDIQVSKSELLGSRMPVYIA